MPNALLAAAATGLATGLGALPFLFVRALPRRFYDGLLGVGAGLMLAAATLGLLAEALEGVHGPGGLELSQLVLVSAGFAAGVALAAMMDRFIPHRHAGGHHHHLAHDHAGHEAPRPRPDHHLELRHVYAVVGALSIHRLPEGIAIGAGFASESARLGWMLTIAVALQNVCEGVVMAAPMRQAGLSRARTMCLSVLTGLVLPLGALLGSSLSALALPALPFVLALAAGTLIYVTSNEVIPESHSHGHEGTASTGVAVGFLFTMLLGAILH